MTTLPTTTPMRLPRSCVSVRRLPTGIWLALVAAITGVVTVATSATPGASWVPPGTLQETGLYADWATKTVAAGTLLFSPQYSLWSDGATKTRWMRLPKGTFIDARNPDVLLAGDGDALVGAVALHLGARREHAQQLGGKREALSVVVAHREDALFLVQPKLCRPRFGHLESILKG